MSSDRPTLHILGLPHTVTREDFSHCAFTSKVRLFAPMMKPYGYHTVHYGVGGAQSGAHEDVELYSEDELYKVVGRRFDPRSPFHWHAPPGEMALTDTRHPLMTKYNWALYGALKDRVNPEWDIICNTFGFAAKPALDELPKALMIETGIGYPYAYHTYRIYESYAWLHNILGHEKSYMGKDYWWVIPNYYDLAEWQPDPSLWTGEYVLLIGRICHEKGMDIFREMARRRPDLQFVFVGQGESERWLTPDVPNLTYRAPVHGMERLELYSRAIATVTMTRFLEPFCQVHIESQLCGTPVISSHFGVFSETVEDWSNGFKCRTLPDALAALERCETGLDRQAILSKAHARYGLQPVGQEYDLAFREALTLHRSGGMQDGGDWWLRLPMHSRHGPIAKALVLKPNERAWKQAQAWETEWWTHTERWDDERRKQMVYAMYMQLPASLAVTGNVLDLGCGPISLLQRAKGFDTAVAVDPLDFNDAAAYAACGVERVVAPAEEFVDGRGFNEVWFYNVLQHVRDPREVLATACRECAPGGCIRLFEWTHTGVNEGHIHEFTEAYFDAYFGDEWEREHWEAGTLATTLLYGTFLAAVLRKR